MTAQIFITCLAAYNAGTLHGEWIPCTDEETIQTGIKHVLETSPENNNPYPCEEVFITDHEGLGAIGEYTPVSEIMERVEFIEESGNEKLALAILDYASDLDTAKTWLQNYIGHFDNRKDFAYGHLEDNYDLDNIPPLIQHNINLEDVAHELFIDGYDEIPANPGIYVFSE